MKIVISKINRFIDLLSFYTGCIRYLNIRFNDNVRPDILKKVDDKMYYKIRKLTSLKINPLSPYDKNIYTHLLNIIFDLSIPVKESVELNDFKKSDEFSIDEGTIITSIQLNDFTLKIHRYNIFKDLLKQFKSDIENLKNKQIAFQKDYTSSYDNLIYYLISNNIQKTFSRFFSINEDTLYIDMNIEIFKPLIKYIEDSDENFKKIETYKLQKFIS